LFEGGVSVYGVYPDSLWGGRAISKKGEQMFLANSESKVAMELQHTHTRARI